LPRRFEQIKTPYGVLQVKVTVLPDGTERATPEYDDCRRLAQEANVPLRVIMDAAKRLEKSMNFPIFRRDNLEGF
jgi:uncharacterized protein (DUF111 family)